MGVFGHTGVGGASSSMTADYKRGSAYNLPLNATVTKLTAYVAGGAATQKLKAVIYNDFFGSPYQLKATSVEVTVGVSQAAGWVDFTISGGVALTPGTYWLGLIAGTTTLNATYSYDYRWGAQRVVADTYSDDPSVTWGAGSSFAHRKMSIYGSFSTLDVKAPEVAVTAPVADATVAGAAVSLTASASDNVGVAGVQFKVDGTNVGAEDTSAPYSVTWDSTAAEDGSHLVTAVARDAAGNTTTSAAVTVTAANQTDEAAPTCAVVWPPVMI